MGCGASRLDAQDVGRQSFKPSREGPISQPVADTASHKAPDAASGADGCGAGSEAAAPWKLQPLADSASSTAPRAAALLALSEAGGADNWEEQQRLAAVRRLKATPPGDRFNPITELLKNVFDAPMAFVTLIDEHEVLSNAFGLPDWTGHPRGDTVCEWVLKQPQPEMIIIEDMTEDARFNSLTAVAGPPHLRFYASAPLVSPGPAPLRYGTLCVVDFKPRSFPASQYQMLAQFTHIVVAELERDMAVEKGEEQLQQAKVELRGLARSFEGLTDAVLVCHVAEEGWPVVYGNPAATSLMGVQQLPQGAPFWDLFAPADSYRGRSGRERMQQMVAKGQPFSLACRLQSPDAAPGRPVRLGELESFGSGLSGEGGFGNGWLPTSGGSDNRRISFDSALGSRTTSGMFGGPYDSRVSDGLPRSSATSISGTSNRQVLAVAFAPCTAAGLFDASPSPSPAIGIPLTDSEAGEGGGAGQPQQQPYWFATLSQTTTAARLELLGVVSQGSALLGSGGSSGAPGAISSGNSAAAASGEHMMRPEAMKEVEMGALLGAGASGRTYRAVWQGSRVAVKIIEVREAERPAFDSQDLGPLSNSGSAFSCLDTGNEGSPAGEAPILEALLSKALSHPHIVRTHAYGVSEHESAGQKWKEVWIVQELCTGGTLARAIETGKLRDPATGQARLGFVLRTAVEVAGALAYLHSNGVLHGDLTGNNILLSASSKDSRKFVAMVADFGLSRPLDVLSVLTTGTYGTVSHMPPELIIDGQLTSAADVFSFGVVLWEMMSGKRAWERMNALQIINAVTVQRRTLAIPDSWPELVQELVGRCLHLDPNQRPTARDLLSDLYAMVESGTRSANASLALESAAPDPTAA